MDYMIGGVFLFVAVVLVFAATSRRLAGRRNSPQTDRGVTFAEPAADEPTPGAGGNAATSAAERRIPPA
jgi:hypothetical protein